MKEFQKKSLAMLFAMFMLGACSTVGDDDTVADTEEVTEFKTRLAKADSTIAYATIKGELSAYSFNVKTGDMTLIEENKVYTLDSVDESYKATYKNGSENIIVYINFGGTSVEIDSVDYVLSGTLVDTDMYAFISTGDEAIDAAVKEGLVQIDAETTGQNYEQWKFSRESSGTTYTYVRFIDNARYVEVTVNSTTEGITSIAAYKGTRSELQYTEIINGMSMTDPKAPFTTDELGDFIHLIAETDTVRKTSTGDGFWSSQSVSGMPMTYLYKHTAAELGGVMITVAVDEDTNQPVYSTFSLFASTVYTPAE